MVKHSKYSKVGDMLKSVYDTDEDGRVDNAENLNDGTNIVTASQAKTAVNKSHTQGTDQYLDQGGPNQVSAISAKNAADNAHSQNTDDYLDQGGANEVSASQLKTLKDTTVPGKADKVSGATENNFAALNAQGNLIDSGHKDSDYADSNHNHDTEYLALDNTTPFTPDANYEPATKKYVDDSVIAAGGGDMTKAVYDTDNDGIVDKAENVDDGTGNSSTAAQVKSAVDDSHSHANKSLLDTYNQTNANISDAVSKKHTQNTDTGTNQNTFSIGDGADTDKYIEINNGDANAPKIRYNSTTSKWQYSHNGVDWYDFGTASGAGDMLKTTYDTNDNGIADKAESIDDNAGNTATAANIKDAVTKKHTQGTDQYLDQGGANEVSAAHAKDSYDHSQVSSGNPHSVTKTEVGLSNVPNLNTTDAVNNQHVQNTDSGTSQNDFSVGDGNDTNKTITIDNGDANQPQLRYNSVTNIWEYSNNGVDWYAFGVASGGGSGSGDMSKSTYDIDEDGIVDAAESIDDGVNSLTATQIINSISAQIYNSILAIYLFLKTNTLVFRGIVNGWVDAFADESGIDTGSSSGVEYNASNDYYTNIVESADIDSNTKLMLHCNGSDTSTTITDDSPSAHTMTANGDAQLDTTIKKWGTASLQFDGNDSVTTPDSADWDFWASDLDNWSIDFWVYHNAVSSTQIYIDQTETSNTKYVLRLQSDNSILSFVQDGGVYGHYAQTATSTMAASGWYHIAVIKVGTDTGIYVNGIQKAYDELPSNSTFTAALSIGTSLNGYMDEIRIQNSNPFDASPNVGNTDTITIPTSEYVATGTIYDMTLISESQSALAVPTQAWIWFVEEDIDSITINTDLKAYISRDNGTSWTEATLSYLGDYDTDEKMYGALIDISSQPSGSDMLYKLVTDNEKRMYFHGTGIYWE